jgi:hypothetical protein
MDCRTARLLMNFGGPRPAELDESEADALALHLAGCAECAALDHADREFDSRVRQAVCQVEIPSGLRDRLVARLTTGRDRWYRRWYAPGARAAAVAAMLLVGLWALWMFYPRPQPALDLHELLSAQNLTGHGAPEVSAAWARLGVPAVAPECFAYAFHTGESVAELPGIPHSRVPLVEFAEGKKSARVFVISNQQSDLKPLAQNLDDNGYRWRVKVLNVRGDEFRPGDTTAYLVYYTGGDIDWLLQR